MLDVPCDVIERHRDTCEHDVLAIEREE